MFEHLRAKITDPSRLSSTPAEIPLQLRVTYPHIPEAYLQFLQEIGTGDIGGMRMYSGPVNPDDIYPEISAELAPVILFGDDFQGYCYGFDTTRHFQLVEVEPSGEAHLLDESFEKFIEDYVD